MAAVLGRVFRLGSVFGLLGRLMGGIFAFVSRFIRKWVEPIHDLMVPLGAWANIPLKRNREDAICFSPYLYRARNHVERFFNRIKHCRRIETRYDTLVANYLAFVKLAAIRLWLGVYESTS